MIVTSTYRGRTLKRVTFAGLVENETDDRLVEAAMTALRETRSSLFGHGVERHDNGAASVTLHTD